MSLKKSYRSLYSFEEIDTIKQNLSTIQQKAVDIFNEKYLEPKEDEYQMVRKIILDFIKSNKRIIYGGYAQNELIKMKNLEDDFYGNTRADIEFYSPEPIKDLIELCDIINEKKIFNVKGDEGVHPETYKLFANFENYADISYMDPNVFNNCPYIEKNGLRFCHPHFMLVDGYRVYTDPMTSYFRLDKAFGRFMTLEKNYPIPKLENESLKYEQYLDKKVHEEILRNIRKLLIMNSNFIVVGHYGVEYLTKKIDIEIGQYPYYQMVTTNLNEDYLKIYNILKSVYGKKISYKKYYKFFMFWDNRIEFYYDKQVILKLYGNNERCVVYQFSDKKKTHFGTFQLIMLYLLIDYNYAKIYNLKNEEKNYLILMNKLYQAKDQYLAEHNLSLVEPSNFQHFTLKCIGKAIDPIRESRIKGIERLKQGKSFKFSYIPQEGKKGKVPEFKFMNSSGLMIDTRKNK